MGAGALDRRTEEHLVPRARGSTEFEPMIAGDVVGDLRWHRHRELALRGSRRIDATVDMEVRSEEHTSELQSLMRISYAVFCLKKKKTTNQQTHKQDQHHSQH